MTDWGFGLAGELLIDLRDALDAHQHDATHEARSHEAREQSQSSPPRRRWSAEDIAALRADQVLAARRAADAYRGRYPRLGTWDDWNDND